MTAKRRTPPAQPHALKAAIQQVERSYYISESAGENARFEDEAILGVTAQIEEISPPQRRFLGCTIEMSFITARTFRRDEPAPPAERPFLMPIQLRKNRCSLAAYLPADAFWELASMIASKEVTHVEARFTAPSRGTGNLLSVYFAPARLMDPIS